MNIQAINNTNFRGLFIDKSRQNNGEWKMEYSPYSWEKKNPNEFGMAPQTDLDIMTGKLPDNEKIYTTNHRYEQGYWCVVERPEYGREECKDILGTEFYYKNFESKKMRNRIDEIPAMNREDSLVTLNNKLSSFWYMKKQELDEIKKSFKPDKELLDYASDRFDFHSKDFDCGIFDGYEYSERDNKKYMVEQKNKIVKSADSIYDNINKYIILRDSADAVKSQITENTKEIKLLKEARESGRLIDISRRFLVNDPNKALWDAMHDFNGVQNKIVALPNMTIAAKDILKAIGAKVGSPDIPSKAINYVDKAIAQMLK